MVQLLLAFFLGGRVSRSVYSSGLANKGLKRESYDGWFSGVFPLLGSSFTCSLPQRGACSCTNLSVFLAS